MLVQPLLTEKITALRESSNTVGFFVHPDANRVQIKQAVETLLKVKVERVNVMNVHGKIKRLGRFSGKRSDWKKAFVKLKEGEKLSEESDEWHGWLTQDDALRLSGPTCSEDVQLPRPASGSARCRCWHAGTRPQREGGQQSSFICCSRPHRSRRAVELGARISRPHCS